METIKRYVFSSLITFIAGVLLVITPEIQNLTPESFQNGTVVGLIFAGARLGTKMIFELFLNWYSTNPPKNID